MIPDDRQTGGRTLWTTLSVTLKGLATLNGKDQGQEQWVRPHLNWHNYKKGAESSAKPCKGQKEQWEERNFVQVLLLLSVLCAGVF